MRKVLLLVALVVTLIATPSLAKEGFYLGVNVLFNDISGDDNTFKDVQSGNGLGLRGGFGLNRYLAIEAGLWKTNHDVTGSSSVDLKAGTIDLKINFPLSGSHIEPYLIAGVGSYTIEDNTNSFDGKGGQIGIGMDIYLFPELNFNVGLARRNITFDVNGTDQDAKITSLDFGLTYHFL